MPKALFFNVPAHGHVNPSLPLVAELVRRGHAITYFVTERFRASVERTGAQFQPYASVDDDYFAAGGLDGSRPQKVAAALLEAAERLLPELLDHAHRAQPDYVLFDGMCPWGKLVAQVRRVPQVASLSLLPLPAAHTILSWRTLRTIVPMMLRDVGKGLEAGRRARALGKTYGVPPPGPATFLNALGDLSISYTSSFFQPFADTVSKTVLFVGWTPEAESNDTAARYAPGPGRRLIYISLGTINNANPAFFQQCVAAFAGAAQDVLISTGGKVRPEALGPLPPNITVQEWVPQRAVLKHVALFITHGGLGSVHDGLAHGVPLLVVPQQEEQRMTAYRVVDLGAGLLLRPDEVSAATLRAAAARLLDEPGFLREAQHVGATLHAAGGAPRAADAIEQLLSTALAR